MSLADTKNKVIETFIENVPFEGWNRHNLKNTCTKLGLEEGYDEILFPNAVGSLTNEIIDQVNVKFLNKLQNADLNGLRLGEKIEEAIYYKILSYHEKLKNKETLKKFSAYCLNLEDIKNTLSAIFGFSSEVWHYFGDESTDFSYYTKRLSLSDIYIKSFTYSLSDNSDNLQETRNFIKRSIDGLMKFHKLKSKIINFFPKISKR